MAVTINLKTYRENKEIIKNFKKINNFFISAFPNKSAGWVGLTLILYSQMALGEYLKTVKNINPNLITALRATLQMYISELDKYENSRKGRK